MKHMKITAGMGSIDDYVPFVQAGADELFCGYVPREWMEQGGLCWPLNRREVLYVNVQAGSESELEILSGLIRRYRVPVSITLNGLFYAPWQYPAAADLVRRCVRMGFSSFIAADPALLIFLKKNVKEPIQLHISGELSEVNHGMIEEMRCLGAGRIIFHRKVSPENMRACIAWEKQMHPQEELEYEAFALNELCHFTGAFCNSLHCDELAPACRLPYRLEGEKESDTEDENEPEAGAAAVPEAKTGQTGCALCALWRLQEAGVTHLKLVSRGNYAAQTIEDIRRLRRALELLEHAESETDYITRMKQEIFPEGCSRMCYYRENSGGTES